MRVVLVFGLVGAFGMGLAGCDGKSSAVATRDQQGQARSYGAQSSYGGSGSSYSYGQGGGQSGVADPRDAPVPQVNGKPMWAANRKHTAEDNAEYQFGKNGGDFGARSETEYVTKVHAFIDHPPRDAETIARNNGDKLIYDPGGNVFAVVSRTGAPRTMFKPRDGASYWAQQKDREAKRAKPSDSGSGSSEG
jgi:pyocin large subunit-like protein